MKGTISLSPFSVIIAIAISSQVFKYREHILFIQNKVSKSSPFRPLPFHDTGNKRATSVNEACKLYGPNATQYINHGLPSPINPVSGGLAGGDSKFRNDKKAYQVRVGEAGGRPWQVSVYFVYLVKLREEWV